MSNTYVPNTYAIIDADNRAVNFVLWDGVSEYNPGEGLRLVPLQEGISYGGGWIYDPVTETFTNPNPQPEPTPNP